LRLWSAQIRAMASLPIPTLLPSVRVDHWVEPSAGLSCWVSLSTSATVPAGNQDLRPRPLAITPTPSTPVSEKRARQRRTASESRQIDGRSLRCWRLPLPTAARGLGRPCGARVMATRRSSGGRCVRWS
jgi:hypothetical protein